MLTSVAYQEQQPIADYIDLLAHFIKNILKIALYGHYYLQRAVTPD
jgi:hypothetical protein